MECRQYMTEMYLEKRQEIRQGHSAAGLDLMGEREDANPPDHG